MLIWYRCTVGVLCGLTGRRFSLTLDKEIRSGSQKYLN